ncbi:MAG: DNA polymerase III subunit chi [Desulfuromonadaceae bacterium]|nr:DNA polymerase III subunit chi [Desulfuromonadaceae bacterium]
MQPVVEFVRLERAEKAKVLCQLAQQFFGQKHRVLIRVEDAEQAMALDRYMWTWDRGSFLPHVWDNGAVECYDEPITICTEARNSNGATVLIAGAPCALDFSRRFRHVVDFAETWDDKRRAAARERFKLWRELGCQPTMREAHPLETGDE